MTGATYSSTIQGLARALGRGRVEPIARDQHRLLEETIGCVMCGRSSLVRGLLICAECRREYAPTPAAAHAVMLGLTAQDVVDLSGVSLRTVRRAFEGTPIGKRLAAQLGKVLGVDPAKLVAGTPAPAVFSADPEVRRAHQEARENAQKGAK